MDGSVWMAARWTVVGLALASLVAACGGSGGGGGGGAVDAVSDATSDATGDVSADSASDGAGGDTTAGTDSGGSDGTDAAGPVCKAPEQGVCVGTTLTYCEVGVGDQSYDCDDGEGASCAKISDDYGYDCVLPKDATCTYFNDDDELDWAFCAGAGAGCVYTAGKPDAACQTGQPACTEDEIGDCKGSHVLLDCYGSQPFSIDCKDFGATCSAGNMHATCEGIAKGGVCDDVFLFCAGDAECVIDEDADFGVCP